MVELTVIYRGKRRSRVTGSRACYRTSTPQHFLANSQAKSKLLFVTQKWQVNIEQIFDTVSVAGKEGSHYLHQHLGIDKAGHGAVHPTAQFLREM